LSLSNENVGASLQTEILKFSGQSFLECYHRQPLRVLMDPSLYFLLEIWTLECMSALELQNLENQLKHKQDCPSPLFSKKNYIFFAFISRAKLCKT
jgi:hypothetical protein